LALSVALGGTTYAATGGNLILGQSNTASSTTALSAGTTGPAFKVTNTSTGTGGSFNVAAGHQPFTVNSGTKVTNLNADKLDGKDSTAFLGATAKAADSDQLDGIDSTQFTQGKGSVRRHFETFPNGATVTFGESGIFSLTLTCNGFDSPASFSYTNSSPGSETVFWPGKVSTVLLDSGTTLNGSISDGFFPFHIWFGNAYLPSRFATVFLAFRGGCSTAYQALVSE